MESIIGISDQIYLLLHWSSSYSNPLPSSKLGTIFTQTKLSQVELYTKKNIKINFFTDSLEKLEVIDNIEKGELPSLSLSQINRPIPSGRPCGLT